MANGFDCYSLVRHIQRQLHGVAMPIIDVDSASARAVADAFATSDEYANWQECSKPIDGDVVMMMRGSRLPHIGLWADVDGGLIFHSLEGIGTCYHAPSRLMTQTGLRVTAYYTHSTPMAQR